LTAASLRSLHQVGEQHSPLDGIVERGVRVRASGLSDVGIAAFRD
jgi:hypothetical protein